MDKSGWIVPLASIVDSEVAKVGGKAAGLGRLWRAGFRVPDGFCVSVEGYRKHVGGALSETVAGLARAPEEQKTGILSQIRDRIVEAPLSKDFIAEIARAYATLEARSVAVRSSASAEDLPDHSFAGQYETFLTVTSLELCLEAIRKCWASLWTDRAYEYRCRNGIDQQQVEMAVIVQKQIDAEVAGVAFSLDPVTGSPSRIVIESCLGLGDALVSGRVQPDRIVLRKKNLELIRQTKASQETDASLDLRTARKLARRVRKMEKRFGSPQDVEWAIRDGRIWFLQARPITAVPPAKPWEERQVWTNFNLGEVVPDVMTPATWSMIETILFPMLGGLGRLVGVDGNKHPPAGQVAGRLYWHVNAGLAAARPFVSMSTLGKSGSMFGGDQIRMYELGEMDIPDEALPDVGFRWPRYVLSWPRILYDLFTHRVSQADKFLVRLRSRSDDLRRLDVGAAPTDDLVNTATKLLRDSLADCDLLYLLSGAPPIGVFQKACQDWLGGSDSTTAYRLLAAQGGISDTEAGLDLWRLAVLAHEDSETKAALDTEGDWETVHPQLGRRFLAAWDQFMTEHGHHCRGELEFANARWNETPDYVLDLVRSYLRSIDQVDPLARQEELAREQTQLAEQCRRQLRNPIKRWLFNWSLRRTRKAARDRENWKDGFVRLVAFYRRVLLELGERLHREGILAESNDILFLKLAEIAPVTQGGAEFDVKECIATRRAEYEWNCSVTPPPVVIGRFDPDKHVVPEVDANVEVLKGIAVSSGVVTGKARVILRTDDDQHIESGEILVAPFTDPAWTPYFLPAAGIVMDMGGVLSHGAVIAREYGLPAVVNVGPATKIIKTGQAIRVDGDKGIVTILDEM